MYLTSRYYHLLAACGPESRPWYDLSHNEEYVTFCRLTEICHFDNIHVLGIIMMITSCAVCIVLCWCIDYDDRDTIDMREVCTLITPLLVHGAPCLVRCLMTLLLIVCGGDGMFVISTTWKCYVTWCRRIWRNIVNPFSSFLSCSSAFNATHKQLVYLASSKVADYSDTNFYR